MRPGTGTAERLLFSVMGVADPAHHLHHLYLRRALDLLDLQNPTRILDAGCGAGDHAFYLARRFPQSRVTGVDLDAARIEENMRAARRLNLRNVDFEVADLGNLEDVEQFDLIVSVDVLEHIPDQVNVIAGLKRSLRRGAFAFFHLPTTRTRPVLFSRYLHSFHAWAESEHLAEERTASEFLKILQGVGFQVINSVETFGLLTGELATSLFALPHAPGPMNRILQALLAPACRIISLGDFLHFDNRRYAVAVILQKPA